MNEMTKSTESILRNENNEIIVGIETNLNLWKQYIEELFRDNRPDSHSGLNFELKEEGPAITKN